MTNPPSHPAPSKVGAAVFATTRWTLVLQSRGESPEARAALADLCDVYYRPVERFIRQSATDPESARDLTQEFFARLLAGSGVRGADPLRGRFRSYVLGAVKHFLQVERTRRAARRRGGQAEHVPLPSESDTPCGPALPPDPKVQPADQLFDRHWAVALLDRALDRLGRELAAEDKTRQFECLKPSLLGADAPRPQIELAAQLGLSESAVKVAIHRLRKRFRQVIRTEIAETLADPGQVDEEMHHLLTALT